MKLVTIKSIQLKFEKDSNSTIEALEEGGKYVQS